MTYSIVKFDRENNQYISQVVNKNPALKEAIKSIYANGHIPILVGGTGFYIQSVLYDIDFTKNNDLIELIINDVVSICCIDVYDENLQVELEV